MPQDPKNPTSWYFPFKDTEATGELQDDEMLRLAMFFSIKSIKLDKVVSHSIFTVVNKGDKSIARCTVVHIKENEICPGHTADVAHYDVKDEEELKLELIDLVKYFASKMVNENNTLTLDQNGLYLLMVPKAQSKDQIYAHISSDTRPEGQLAAEVISQVLRLNTNQPKSSTDSSLQLPAKENTSKLVRAAEEMALVTMYGKKKMETLAKKIGYKGETINKTE